MTPVASSTTNLIIAEKRNGVGYLGFNRPEKHNAISYEMWQGIAKVMADFEADDTVRAVVVSGEGGRAFSAGADISQFEKQRASTDTIEEYNVAAGLAHEQLTNISKPTIAKIVGYCIGGGLGIALCCDLASRHRRFKIWYPRSQVRSWLRLRWVEAVSCSCWSHPRQEILFTARQFDAAEAYDMGPHQ